MTQARTRLTFDEYLNLDAEGWLESGLPEGRCEYVEDGELIELSPESRPNDAIANYLFLLLVSAGLPPNLVTPGKCEVTVPKLKPKTPRSRYPDLVVLQPEHLELTKRRFTITQSMPPPVLVAEVVSPGSTNNNRDYEDKFAQYQARGIPEYWIINPETQTIEVLELRDGCYVEFGKFQGSTLIQSPTLATLPFTVEQVFSAGG